MNFPLMQRYKVVLLRNAARRGAPAFLRQAWLTLADSFLREKELVFRLGADDVPTEPIVLPNGIRFQEVTDWEDLPTNFRTRVMDPTSGLEWNGHDWFGKGRRLWVGTQNGSVAALGWWCGSDEASTHFYPIPKGSESLIHITVLPEHRGRNLQVLLQKTLMQMRIADGVRAFYIHCRDYNAPSYHNILKSGFKSVGHTMKPRIPRHSAKRIEIAEHPP